MPFVVGESKDRVEELLGELVDKIDEHLAAMSEPQVVNVELGKVSVPPPVVNVSVPPPVMPAIPAPVVRVEAPVNVEVPAPVVNVEVAAPDKGSWLFTVSRDSEGFISTITATPK